jgi:hypothetical protein
MAIVVELLELNNAFVFQLPRYSSPLRLKLRVSPDHPAKLNGV